jgi:Na+/H+-dicarboxylate symporter
MSECNTFNNLMSNGVACIIVAWWSTNSIARIRSMRACPGEQTVETFC